jgi:hypothetical protein
MKQNIIAYFDTKYHIAKLTFDIHNFILKALPNQCNAYIIVVCFFKCSNLRNIPLTLSLLVVILLTENAVADISLMEVGNYSCTDLSMEQKKQTA